MSILDMKPRKKITDFIQVTLNMLRMMFKGGFGSWYLIAIDSSLLQVFDRFAA